ncbi:hypothetical protein ADILRU_1148 [Leifsonia rubra CMS 76R]|nr:hypothetical protein ADILRU_1148 [Leifsonia rubra CMS 76R]
MLVSAAASAVALTGVLAYSGVLAQPNEGFLWGTVAGENLPGVLAAVLIATVVLLFSKRAAAAFTLVLVSLPWIGASVGLVWRAGSVAGALITFVALASVALAVLILGTIRADRRLMSQAN